MKYDLVFQGGGARGMVLVGAYQEFVQRGITPGRLLGTSAGAITATLIAAGYTPEEMLTALEERENDRSVFVGFLGHPAPFSRQEIQSSAIRMSDERRAALVQAGRRAMGEHFDQQEAASAGRRGLETAMSPQARHTADRIALRLLGQDME